MRWRESWRADPAGRRIADNHYNRQKVGADQFVPPGRCVVLVIHDSHQREAALWVTSWPFGEYVKHAWPGAWVCSSFRNQLRDDAGYALHRSSEPAGPRPSRGATTLRTGGQDMMATVSKRFTFDAAHHLDRLPPDHKCHRMHGHTYEVELVFFGVVQRNGFVLDYADIAKVWAPIHARIDHRVLNEVPGLEVPSTEILAHWIFAHVSVFDSAEFRIDRVRVYESSTTWCEVSGLTRSQIDEILRSIAKS